MTREEHQKRREILGKLTKCPECDGFQMVSRESNYQSVREFVVENCSLCCGAGKVPFCKAAEYLLSR